MRFDRLALFYGTEQLDDGFATRPGARTLIWSEWCNRKDVGDAERVQAAQVNASITARFVARWSEGLSQVTTADELECEGVTFNITGIKEIGTRDRLEFSVAAKGAAE